MKSKQKAEASETKMNRTLILFNSSNRAKKAKYNQNNKPRYDKNLSREGKNVCLEDCDRQYS